MCKNKILEKLLAIVLIFTLTFANFAFVTKSYASFADTIFDIVNSDTGSKDVEFEAYFETEEENETSVISDVNNKDLAINMNLNIKENGYIKDAKIQILEAEEGKGLNFDLSEKSEFEEVVKNFEDNTYYLNQIDGKSEVKIQVPIEYKNEEFVNENKISSDNKVLFTGTYVNNDGEEKELSKEVLLNVSWKDNRDIKLNTEPTKYIDYGDGIILQSIERIDNSSEGKTLPVKSTELEINVPILKNAKPSKVTVVANTTEGTNGDSAGELEFSENNWIYNAEENKLIIKIDNNKELVEVKENADEYLQDGEKEVVQEERYFNGSGIDEFLVTYTYSGVDVAEEETVTINTSSNARMTTISGVEKEDNINIVTENKESSYDLQGKSGEIISLTKENKKEEISKAYTYVNYNNPGKYETEIPEDTIINISYKDILEGIEVRDEENTYVDKTGNVLPNADIYYKRVSISKENFNTILGENGEIKVKDENENIVAIINKDLSVNESGMFEIGFAEKYSRLSFEISKPISEGNLVITTVKALSNAGVDKPTYANLDKLVTRASIKANYNYVEEPVEVGQVETMVKLIDTNTDANLVIDRDSLSTVEENNDVEIRVELNNARENSDIFGHSEFEIELPENVEKIDVTNISLLYGEGLQISSKEVNERIIRVTLDGVQEGINSGVLTNGTNIVINANIKVNLYTPAKTETIKFRYNNSESTNYVNNANKELPIMYSAPTGLVAVNSISNYNDEAGVVASVKQGKKEGVLAVYAPAREVTTELIIMNNNANQVSEISILGRTAFAGVKDIQTGEELGTTLDSKMTSMINPDSRNRVNFVIYYSENENATRNLEDANNGWTQTPENLENVKSYLIVPEDANYIMESAEVVRFTYTNSIPENLTHNEYFYGTFGVNYRNNSELSQTNEISIADLVGLTTGVGPELSVVISDEKEKVKENEEFSVKVKVQNDGQNIAENVNIEIPVPAGSKYCHYEIDNQRGIVKFENERLLVSFDRLEVGESIEIDIYLIAKPLEVTGEYQSQIQVVANVTAKDLMTVLTQNSIPIQIEFAEFYILEEGSYYPKIERAGNEVHFRTKIINSSTEVKNNVVVTKVLPKEFTFISASEGYSYDETTKTITWNLGSLDVFEEVLLKVTVAVNELEENVGITEIKTTSRVKASNSEEYESNTVITTVGKPVLTITQTTENINTYLKEGDIVKYSFIVKNEGGVTATDVNLTDKIPQGIVINKITYKVGDVELNKEGYFNDKIELAINIEPGQEWKLDLQGEATSLGGAEEQSATNVATVSSKDVKEIESNSITHIIEASNEDIQNGGTSSSSSDRLPTTKTYKITGTAWVDSNEDGMRNANEELLTGVVVRLVNSETGVIQKSITTDSKGIYTFSGIQNGNYLVIFEYDTATYKVTAYQKEGILANVNSDVITTTIEQDGKTREGAVTDVITINNGSISDIDIGLVLANTFDLKINKGISKVTVQMVNGKTTSENYDNVDIAKTEIHSKNIVGSTIFVEYTITVTNIGDISGYAKKVVDYIPEGMNFNSSLDVNKDWYTGLDQNLYTNVLEDKELKPEESVTLKLVLTKQMTADNTGLVNNKTEIYEDYNTLGIADINSTPGNKVQGENDLNSADIILSVKTGEVFIYVSVIIITILLGSIAIFVVYNKIVVAKRKGGV